MPAPAVGEPAPDFTLTGTEGEFKLSEQRGSKVVLLFYPGDFTLVCTRQFCSYRDDSDEISKLGARIVGISPQGLDSHTQFQAKYGIETELLADAEKDVARSYGLLQPGGRVRRATFIVDEEGILRFCKRHLLGATYESAEDLSKALESL